MIMEDMYTRTALLLGEDGMERIKRARVLLFGLGGVGSYTAEALARVGIGEMTLVDGDTISVTNINRQIPAKHSTIGMEKTQVLAERILDINPLCRVEAVTKFVAPENIGSFVFEKYDYVIDAVDNVTAKLMIIKSCWDKNVPVISSMGTGNKLDPTRFEIDDIYNTSVCPLARVMRRELRKLGVGRCRVLYSREEPIKNSAGVPGSISFVPSVAGLLIAGAVIRDIAGV